MKHRALLVPAIGVIGLAGAITALAQTDAGIQQLCGGATGIACPERSSPVTLDQIPPGHGQKYDPDTRPDDALLKSAPAADQSVLSERQKELYTITGDPNAPQDIGETQ